MGGAKSGRGGRVLWEGRESAKRTFKKMEILTPGGEKKEKKVQKTSS
jgi:hypothetical protein